MSALVLALVLAGQGAPAFVCTRAGAAGPSLFWDRREVVVARAGTSARLADVDVDAAIAAAAAAWSGLPCGDLTVSVGGASSRRVAGFDWAAGKSSPLNANIIVFRTGDEADPVDQWLHSFGALAITTVTFVSTTGELLDADVEVNEETFPFSACDPPGCVPTFDLANTLTHELGHVIGLDHPPRGAPGAAEATMAPSAAEGDLSKRDLADDDVAGACTIYPAGAAAGNCFDTPRTAPPAVTVAPSLCSATELQSGSASDLGGRLALPGALGLLLAGWRFGRRALRFSRCVDHPLTSAHDSPVDFPGR